MDRKIIINCSVQKQVVQMHYDRETGCADVQPQRTWLCMSYGTETGYADVLWHRKWLFRCDMAQDMLIQACFGT